MNSSVQSIPLALPPIGGVASIIAAPLALMMTIDKSD